MPDKFIINNDLQWYETNSTSIKNCKFNGFNIVSKNDMKRENVFNLYGQNGKKIEIDENLNVKLEHINNIDEASKVFWECIKNSYPKLAEKIHTRDYITYSFALLKKLSEVKLDKESKELLEKSIKLGEELFY